MATTWRPSARGAIGKTCICRRRRHRALLEPLRPTRVTRTTVVGARSEIVEGVIVEAARSSRWAFLSARAPESTPGDGCSVMDAFLRFVVVPARASSDGNASFMPVIVKPVDAGTRAKPASTILLREIKSHFAANKLTTLKIGKWSLNTVQSGMCGLLETSSSRRLVCAKSRRSRKLNQSEPAGAHAS